MLLIYIILYYVPLIQAPVVGSQNIPGGQCSQPVDVVGSLGTLSTYRL